MICGPAASIAGLRSRLICSGYRGNSGHVNRKTGCDEVPSRPLRSPTRGATASRPADRMIWRKLAQQPSKNGQQKPDQQGQQQDEYRHSRRDRKPIALLIFSAAFCEPQRHLQAPSRNPPTRGKRMQNERAGDAKSPAAFMQQHTPGWAVGKTACGGSEAAADVDRAAYTALGVDRPAAVLGPHACTEAELTGTLNKAATLLIMSRHR